ncbi:glycosyltransferase, partial [Rhizobium ruizarguesonis]
IAFGSALEKYCAPWLPPKTISLLDEALRVRMRITQQVRPEDMEMVSGCVAKLEIGADIAPFFTDMAERLARAHLVICSSGA